MKKYFYFLFIIVGACVPKVKVKNGWQAFKSNSERFETILTRDFFGNDTLIKQEKYYKYPDKAPILFSYASFKGSNNRNGWSIHSTKDGYTDSAFYENNKLVVAINHWSYQREKQIRANDVLIDSVWSNKNILTRTSVLKDTLLDEYHNDEFANFRIYEPHCISFKHFDDDGYLIRQSLPNSFPHIKKSKENCKFGLLNKKGVWVLADEYDFISEFVNDKAIVFKNDLCGIVDTSGKFLLPLQKHNLFFPEGSDYESYDFPKSEIAFYTRNKHCVIFQPQGGKTGLLHLLKGTITEPLYTNIYFYFWQSNIVILENGNEEILTDTLGNVLQNAHLKYRFNNKLNDLQCGTLQTIQKDKLGLVNIKGVQIIPNLYDDIKVFRTDSVFIALNLKDSLADFYTYNGNLINRIKANSYELLSHNRLAIKYQSSYSFIDAKAHVILAGLDSISELDLVKSAKYPKFITKKGNVWRLIDANGINVLATDFEYLNRFYTDENISQCLLVAKKNGRYGIIDEFGNVYLPLKFKYRDQLYFGTDSVVDTHLVKYPSSRFIFNDANGVGFVDKGRFILQPIYLSVTESENYIEIVKKDSSTALATQDGKIIIEGKSKRVYGVQDGIAQLSHDDNSTVFNVNGDKLYTVPGTILKCYPNFVYVENKHRKVGVYYKNGKALIDTIYGQICEYDTISNSFWVTEKVFGIDLETGEEQGYFSSREMFEGGWNLYNQYGKQVLSNVLFPAAFCANDSSIAINWADSTGILNRNLQWNLAPRPGRLEKNNSVYWFVNTGNYQLYNQYGKLISNEGWDRYLYKLGYSIGFNSEIPSLINNKGEIVIRGIPNQYNQSRRLINKYLKHVMDSKLANEQEHQPSYTDDLNSRLSADYDDLESSLLEASFDTSMIDKVFDVLEQNTFSMDFDSYGESVEEDEIDYNINSCGLSYTDMKYFPSQMDEKIIYHYSVNRMYQSTEYSLLSATDNYISILQANSYGDRNSSTTNDTIYNFYIKNGNLYPITLKDILVLTPKNIKKLNLLLNKAVTEYKIDNNESICDLVNRDYVSILKRFFYITNNGITCHLGETGVTKMNFSSSEDEEEVTEYILSFDELKGMLKPHPAISKFME